MPPDAAQSGFAANPGVTLPSTPANGSLPRPVAIPTARAVPDRMRPDSARTEAVRRSRGWRAWGVAPPGWLTSAILHALALIVLALWISETQSFDPLRSLVASMATQDEPVSVEIASQMELPSIDSSAERFSAAEYVAVVPLPDPSDELDQTPSGPVANQLGLPPTTIEALLASNQLPTGGGLEGRSPAARSNLAVKWDADGRGDAAIQKGLQWIVAHQRPDGSWNFNHLHEQRCPDMCRNTGTAGTTTGATAVALLALLGAGETHTSGRYTDQIRRGLYYLSHKAIETPQGVDLQEGTMYAQGLATIALCEAYAMTKDENLRPWAQGAIDYVAYAQDPKGGGWRYIPQEPGDMTVTGWQLMALKAGQLAQLSVPSIALHNANKFLDQVQSEEGSLYGYQKPGGEHTTTAVGLLCRMYQGWPRRHRALQRGMVNLYQWGPSDHDMYYNYYATAALHHYGGGFFERFHADMRAMLLKTQATRGHENGSWFFASTHCDPGGRLLSTALAVMTLEVYYRYLPLYQDDVAEE
ncbi:MAG: hypothetical protein AB7O62_08880 [Pirellulales bacterium]